MDATLARFQKFDRENPKVWELFKQFAEQVLSTGLTSYSAYALLERIRWRRDVETTGDTFKVNNNFKPFYARKLMDEDPRFVGFFRLRRMAP